MASSEAKKRVDRNYYLRNKDKIKKRTRAYALANNDRVRAWASRYRNENRDLCRSRISASNAKNPERRLTNEANRRARKRDNGGFFTASEWISLKKYYGYYCLCCGDIEPHVKLEADHIVPISRGGSSDISNIQPLCGKCNRNKGSKIMDYRP